MPATDIERAGLDEDLYLDATTVTYTVNWLLMVLGEALTVAVREDPEVGHLIPEARSALGLRNRIVHGYNSVDDHVIWTVVQHHLPKIRTQIEAALNEE